MYTKFCVVLQRSRVKDDRISTSDMTVVPIHSKNGQEMRFHELAWKERSHSCSKTTFSILSCEELSAVGKRGWQSSALVSPARTLNRDEAPIGDDIEPVGESRADVEMGNEEDKEPWKQKFTESE